MNKKISFEQTKIIPKIKEISGLVIFIIIAIFTSIILMNFSIFPLAQLSVKNPDLFTLITKYAIIILSLILIILSLIRKIISVYKNDISAVYIIKSIGKVITTFAFGIIITTLLVIFIYWLLQQNYYLLYKIIN